MGTHTRILKKYNRRCSKRYSKNQKDIHGKIYIVKHIKKYKKEDYFVMKRKLN